MVFKEQKYLHARLRQTNWLTMDNEAKATLEAYYNSESSTSRIKSTVHLSATSFAEEISAEKMFDKMMR